METIYVIMHYEYMGFSEKSQIDALQVHVSSSLEKAEKYIRSRKVKAYSWWQIHPHVLDFAGDVEGNEVYYYSHRGTLLKSAPIKRACSAFKKYIDLKFSKIVKFGQTD